MKKITILLMMMIAVWGCKKEEVIPPVVADFTFVEGTNGEFKFTNTSTGATTYEWDFGSGKTSTEESPKFTFDENKDYSILLSAKGVGGQNQKTKSLKVTTRPEWSVPFINNFKGSMWGASPGTAVVNTALNPYATNLFSFKKLDRTTIQVGKIYGDYKFDKLILDAENSFVINETVIGTDGTQLKCKGTGKLDGKALVIDFISDSGFGSSHTLIKANVQ